MQARGIVDASTSEGGGLYSTTREEETRGVTPCLKKAAARTKGTRSQAEWPLHDAGEPRPDWDSGPRGAWRDYYRRAHLRYKRGISRQWSGCKRSWLIAKVLLKRSCWLRRLQVVAEDIATVASSFIRNEYLRCEAAIVRSSFVAGGIGR